jgi:hypothetical protein
VFCPPLPGLPYIEDANKLDFGEFQRALDADHAEGKQRKVDFHNQVRTLRHVLIHKPSALNPETRAHPQTVRPEL